MCESGRETDVRSIRVLLNCSTLLRVYMHMQCLSVVLYCWDSLTILDIRLCVPVKQHSQIFILTLSCRSVRILEMSHPSVPLHGIAATRQASTCRALGLVFSGADYQAEPAIVYSPPHLRSTPLSPPPTPQKSGKPVEHWYVDIKTWLTL